MPYKLCWEAEGVVFRYSGVVSNLDVIVANEEVYASPGFPAMRYQIVDFSVIEGFDVHSATFLAVAASDGRAAQLNPDVKVAVITSATFMRGMAKMYALSHEAGGGSWVTDTFESEEDARAWAVGSD